MESFLKWAFGIALGLAITGHVKSATMNMLEMAIDAQKHQLNMGAFSRMLTAPPSHHSLGQRAGR